MKLYYKNKNKSKSRYQVRWSTDLRYRLEVYGGSFGGVGGAGVCDVYIAPVISDISS